MTNSKTVTVSTNNDKPEQIEPLSAIYLPVDHMLAALSCSSTEETRYYLNGVHIHRHEDTIRAVSTDGHRLFVASTKIADDFDVPGWVEDGVTVHNENLAAKIKLAAKLSNSDSPVVKIAYGKGQPNVIVSDYAEEATFRCPAVDGDFPDYQRLMSSITGGVTPDRDSKRGDFEPVSFNGKYLKAVGDVAKILAGKDGQVSIFANSATEASFISFPEAPGCLMLLMPVKAVQEVAPATAALMAPAIKGTVAALRAHMTRNQEAAEAATDPAEKARYQDKATEFEQRIAAVLTRTLEQPAIEGPAAEENETDKAEADKSDEAKTESKSEAKKDDAKPETKAKTSTKTDATPKTSEKPKEEAKADNKPAPKAETKAQPKGNAPQKPAKTETKAKQAA